MMAISIRPPLGSQELTRSSCLLGTLSLPTSYYLSNTASGAHPPTLENVMSPNRARHKGALKRKAYEPHPTSVACARLISVGIGPCPKAKRQRIAKQHKTEKDPKRPSAE